MFHALILLTLLAGQAEPREQEAGAGLADIPGTTVRYYEVTGDSVTAINRSIARQRPKGPNGKPVPASVDWAVRADFDRRMEGGRCTVSAARASFTGSADLPRLAADSKLDKPGRQRWQNYVDQLQQGSLATLAFVHQNLGLVEQAMLSSGCDDARASGAAAIERLRAHTAKLDAEREKRLAQQNASLSEFRPGGLRAAKNVCRDLNATGSRIRSFRICMPQREWERMFESGEQVTRELQEKNRVDNRP